MLELFVLMVWIGGLGVLLVGVIPAVFNTLGMETGGRFLRRVFDGYNMMVSGVVAVLIGAALFRGWRHRREPERNSPLSRVEIGLLAAIVVVTCLVVGVLGPEAVALQEAAFAADSPDAKRAAFEDFFRLHMIVRALHLINAGLAVALFAMKVRRRLWMMPKTPDTMETTR